MARRRLSPPPAAGDLALAERPIVPHAEHGPAPITQVTRDAAEVAAFAEVAEALRSAREEGRMVLELALDQVAPDHLLRDRLPVEDEEMAALKASIRAHGQRTPIEVTPRGGALPYGLISGWRRLAALRALHAETGEARFATVRALVTRPETAGDAYVAMVEENEVRVGLSQYERARVAVFAARRGVFDSENAALHALFAGASKAKLSRIRSFLEIVHALDGVLRFPQAIRERLGLRLVERLRAGEAGRIAAALAAEAPEAPAAEIALLDRLAQPLRQAPAATEAEALRPGVSLAVLRRGTTLTLTLKGRGVTAELEAEVAAALRRLATA